MSIIDPRPTGQKDWIDQLSDRQILVACLITATIAACALGWAVAG